MSFKNSRTLWNFYCSPVNAFFAYSNKHDMTVPMCLYYLHLSVRWPGIYRQISMQTIRSGVSTKILIWFSIKNTCNISMETICPRKLVMKNDIFRLTRTFPKMTKISSIWFEPFYSIQRGKCYCNMGGTICWRHYFNGTEQYNERFADSNEQWDVWWRKCDQLCERYVKFS